MPVSSPKHIIHYHFIISHVQFNSFFCPHNISCKKNNTKLHKVFWLSGSGLQGKRAITSAFTHSRSRFAKLAISSATNENGSTLSWSSRNHIMSRVCIQSVTISPWAGTSRADFGVGSVFTCMTDMHFVSKSKTSLVLSESKIDLSDSNLKVRRAYNSNKKIHY